MYLVWLKRQVDHRPFQFGGLFANQLLKSLANVFSQHRAPEFRTPDEVIVDVVGCMSGSIEAHKLIIAHLFYEYNNGTDFTGPHSPPP
jgi:hypothetical protein